MLERVFKREYPYITFICCRTPTKTLLIYGFSSIKFSDSTMMSILSGSSYSRSIHSHIYYDQVFIYDGKRGNVQRISLWHRRKKGTCKLRKDEREKNV
jgi:hypothetical protein